MKEMKMAHWFIVVSLLLAGASMSSNNNATREVEEKPLHQQTGNSAGSENWDFAITGSEVFDIEITRIWNDNASTMTGDGWYELDRSGDQPRSFSVELAALNNGWSGQEVYRIYFQLWAVHERPVASGTNIELVKHGLEERVDVRNSNNNTVVEKQVSMVSTNGDKRPTGCYWVSYWVSSANADNPDGAREQYGSGISDRINFASGGDTPCVYDPNLEDNNGDTHDDISFDAGCIAGGGTISATGDCVPSPWIDENGDGDDDASFANGQNSVDTGSHYDAGCIAGGGTISAVGDCIPSPWDDAVDDTDEWDDDSYEAGYGDGIDSVDLPDCTWHNKTWNGTDCVDIVEPTSDDDGCGTCCEDNATCQADLIAANNKLNDTDGDGVIDIWDSCPDTPFSSHVDSTGCVGDITIDPTSPSNPCEDDEGEVNLTGSGEVADLTVIGGAGLIAGIGVSSILAQAGRGASMLRPPSAKGGPSKPNKGGPKFGLDDLLDAKDIVDFVSDMAPGMAGTISVLNLRDEFAFVGQNTSFAEAAGVMAKNEVKVVLVRDKKNREVIGIITEQRFLQVCSTGINLNKTKIGKHMLTNILRLQDDTTMENAVRFMGEKNPDAVVVLNREGNFRGYLSPADYRQALEKIKLAKSGEPKSRGGSDQYFKSGVERQKP